MERPEILSAGLSYELGPANHYDELAATAQLVGTKQGESGLVEMGRELARLILEHPYGSEGFSRVIAKARDLEKRIDEVKELKDQGFSVEDEKGNRIHFYLYSEKAGNSTLYRIQSKIRRLPHNERSELQDRIADALCDYLGYDRGDLIPESVTVGYSGATGNQTTYLDENGHRILMEEVWNHENGSDDSISYIFYPGDQAEAEGAWEALHDEIRGTEAPGGADGR